MKLIHSALPTSEIAQQLATQLISEKLAACASWYPQHACYYWNNELVTEMEVVLELKTTDNLATALQERLCVLHPYDVPMVMVLSVEAINDAYAEWMRNVTVQ